MDARTGSQDKVCDVLWAYTEVDSIEIMEVYTEETWMAEPWGPFESECWPVSLGLLDDVATFDLFPGLVVVVMEEAKEAADVF